MASECCLTELDLSDNAFGPTGVEPIIPLLTSPSFYSIKVLKFNNNGLGIKGGTVCYTTHRNLHTLLTSVSLVFVRSTFEVPRGSSECGSEAGTGGVRSREKSAGE